VDLLGPVAFDLYLYVALAAGFAVGRFVRLKGPWVPRATLATVALLVALLGASLDSVPPVALLSAIPVALALVGGILAITVAVFALLRGLGPGRPATPATGRPGTRRPVVTFGLLAALLAGFGLGRVVALPAAAAIPWVLCALLALVGFGLVLTAKGLERVWVPIVAASVGAVTAAVLATAFARIPLSAALATGLGFGFYSLAGPLVAARLGAVLGLIAFLTNFLREDLTMLLAPYLGRRLGGAGLTAMGGATAMDTTLYFVTRYGDPDSASLALASGLVLTIAASLLVPAVLSLPA